MEGSSLSETILYPSHQPVRDGIVCTSQSVSFATQWKKSLGWMDMILRRARTAFMLGNLDGTFMREPRNVFAQKKTDSHILKHWKNHHHGKVEG